MPTCPVCESQQVLMVLSASKRAVCCDCGARWIRDEGVQPPELPALIADAMDEPFAHDFAPGAGS